MIKIKLFSVCKNKNIEGLDAELYCNFYLIFNKDYIFAFLIDSPNIACTDRHPVRLWKHWIMLLEEEYIEYLRKYERILRRW